MKRSDFMIKKIIIPCLKENRVVEKKWRENETIFSLFSSIFYFYKTIYNCKRLETLRVICLFVFFKIFE